MFVLDRFFFKLTKIICNSHFHRNLSTCSSFFVETHICSVGGKNRYLAESRLSFLCWLIRLGFFPLFRSFRSKGCSCFKYSSVILYSGGLQTKVCTKMILLSFDLGTLTTRDTRKRQIYVLHSFERMRIHLPEMRRRQHQMKIKPGCLGFTLFYIARRRGRGRRRRVRRRRWKTFSYIFLPPVNLIFSSTFR